MSSSLCMNTSSDRVLITSRTAFSSALPVKIHTLELSEYLLYLDGSRYLMAAECLNIELYTSSVWQSSQNPLDSGLLLRAHLLQFLRVIIMPPVGYELIQNRHRNPTDEDQMISFISGKHTLESRTWALTIISLPTKPPPNWIHLTQSERSRVTIYTTVQGFEGKSYSYYHIKAPPLGEDRFPWKRERKATYLLFPQTHPSNKIFLLL